MKGHCSQCGRNNSPSSDGEPTLQESYAALQRAATIGTDGFKY